MARISLTRSIKFQLLVRDLGMPAPHVRGHLEYLWETAHEGVNPVIGDEDAVELAAGWVGERGKFSAALERRRFLDRETDETDDDGKVRGSVRLVIHDYWDNCPEYVLHRRRTRDGRTIMRVCSHCGEKYGSSDERSQYCTATCRKAAWRKRQEVATDCHEHETDSHGLPRGMTDATRPPIPSRPVPSRDRSRSTNVGVADDSPAPPTLDRSPEDPSRGKTPTLRRHTNPAGEIDRLIDYQTEVLNKLDHITDGREREDRGTLLAIARHVPPSIVHAALEATQDARLRSLDGEHRQVHHARYFVDGVKRRCTTAGISSPFTTSPEVTQRA